MTFSPTGQISGQTTYSSFGGGSTNLNIEDVFQWVDNITIIRGNHAIKTGADIRRNHFDNLIGGFGTYIIRFDLQLQLERPRLGRSVGRLPVGI